MFNTNVIGAERETVSVVLEASRTVIRPIQENYLKLFDAVMFNGSGAELYLLIFDIDTVPTGLETPVCAPIRVPALSTASWSNTLGKRFRNGICVAGSTTATAWSDPGASCWIEINYN